MIDIKNFCVTLSVPNGRMDLTVIYWNKALIFMIQRLYSQIKSVDSMFVPLISKMMKFSVTYRLKKKFEIFEKLTFISFDIIITIYVFSKLRETK